LEFRSFIAWTSNPGGYPVGAFAITNEGSDVPSRSIVEATLVDYLP
jgi:hypothetical protein